MITTYSEYVCPSCESTHVAYNTDLAACKECAWTGQRVDLLLNVSGNDAEEDTLP